MSESSLIVEPKRTNK